jgi:hypothetical protein
MRQQSATSRQMQDMPAEQRERVIQTQAKFAGVIGSVGAVVGVCVGMLVTAGALLLVFSTLLGGSATFKQALGVVAHSWVVSVIGTGCGLLVMYLKDPSDFDLRNPAGSNLGFYLDPQTVPKWLVSIGNSLDVFSIWIILLLATGMSIAAKKSWASSLVGVLIPWGLYVLGKAAWNAFVG